MRKVLVLMLVLGLASAANAALSLNLNGEPAPEMYTASAGEVMTIGVVSDDANPYTAYLELVDPGVNADWQGDLVMTDNAGKSASNTPDAYGYVGTFELNAAAFPGEDPQVSAGEQFQAELSYAGPGEAVVNIYNVNWDVPVGTMTIVPEPMTIALLGFGGLLLRRRR